MNYEYKGLYKSYDMTGKIKIGTGIVQVHDITQPMPDFMLQADVVFCDPPCSPGNLHSFYTKADKNCHPNTLSELNESILNYLIKLNPKICFIETFVSNNWLFGALLELFPNVKKIESTYYHRKENNCWITAAWRKDYDFDIKKWAALEGTDEQDVIRWICENVDYDCIADPCMGLGLVGWYANKCGKKFVGTELNPKRLAVLVDGITTGKYKHVGKI